MSDDREKRPRPGRPGTASDPNQANREPARDRGAEQAREAPRDPVPGGPRREERDDKSRVRTRKD